MSRKKSAGPQTPRTRRFPDTLGPTKSSKCLILWSVMCLFSKKYLPSTRECYDIVSSGVAFEKGSWTRSGGRKTRAHPRVSSAPASAVLSCREQIWRAETWQVSAQTSFPYISHAHVSIQDETVEKTRTNLQSRRPGGAIKRAPARVPTIKRTAGAQGTDAALHSKKEKKKTSPSVIHET
jgi:hypothetical protein